MIDKSRSDFMYKQSIKHFQFPNLNLNKDYKAKCSKKPWLYKSEKIKIISVEISKLMLEQ